MIGWKPLDDISLLTTIRDDSFVRPQVIFKHSTRCGISSGALSRMNRNDDLPGTDTYLLDLIRNRQISNAIAEDFGVAHESPQILLVWQGRVVYRDSHGAISYDKLEQELELIGQGQ